LVREKICKLYKKVIRVLITRIGPKGISVIIFIFFLDNCINNRLMSVPIQNDNITAQSPDVNPSNHPIPRINFPSPSPISRPFEKSHRRTNGKESIGPEIKLKKVGKVHNDPNPEKFTKIERKEINIKT
jgi:hypothetical protein